MSAAQTREAIRMNTAELAALLASFVFGAIFAFISAFPRKAPSARPPQASEPAITWPAMLGLDARLRIALELAARQDPADIPMLRQAVSEEQDPRIRSLLDRALAPVMGEPK